MNILSKTLLAVAVTGLAGGSVIDFYYDAGLDPSLTVVLPAGAIASGLFLISYMMEKQMAIYDKEEIEKAETPQHNRAPLATGKGADPRQTAIQLRKK